MGGLLAKTLRDQKRPVIGWGLGLAAMAAMYVSFYPTIRNSAASLDKYLQSLPDAVKQLLGNQAFSSPAGYLRSEVFSILGPILFLVFVIGSGARAIAGEEEAGTLDLLLSTPISRRQVVFNKAVALLAASLGLTLILCVTILALAPATGLDISASRVVAACLMLLLVGTSFGSISLAAGCVTGRRTFALGIAGGFAAFAYVLNVLAPVVRVLQPIRPLSPFRWYLEPDPLVSGVHAAGVLVLLGITLVALTVAFIGFERRDLAA